MSSGSGAVQIEEGVATPSATIVKHGVFRRELYPSIGSCALPVCPLAEATLEALEAREEEVPREVAGLVVLFLVCAHPSLGSLLTEEGCVLVCASPECTATPPWFRLSAILSPGEAALPCVSLSLGVECALSGVSAPTLPL